MFFFVVATKGVENGERIYFNCPDEVETDGRWKSPSFWGRCRFFQVSHEEKKTYPFPKLYWLVIINRDPCSGL